MAYDETKTEEVAEETVVTPENKSKYTQVDDTLRDKLTAIAVKRVRACIEFKQPRMVQIREIEDMVAYKLQPALKGRLNVPFDGIVMNGFLDTLVSQVKGFPKIVFNDLKGSNLEGVKKTQAFFDQDISDTKGKWAQKDRWSKRLCAISNIGIFETHTDSEPEYKSYLNVIDHYDFIFDPSGGADIEQHLHVGRMNLFKTQDGLKNPLYDQAQVTKMKAAYDNKDFKYNEDIYQNKVYRLQALGLNLDSNNYVGENLYNLVELEMTYDDTRYYLLFDYKSGIAIRCCLLEEMFESNLYSYQVWNAIENPFTLMGPGPADMVKVVAEAIRLNLNEILNNNRKRNWGMTAVDKTMFPDISALDYKQDGIVPATVPVNGNIQNGIFTFTTPEISGAINLNTYLNGIVGVNSGISDQTKGESSQNTLGVAKIDDMNLSKRMTLISDSYQECLAGLVLRWDWNQWEHLDDKYSIKILGKDGPELVDFEKTDSEPDYGVSIITKTEDIARDKLSLESKANGLKLIVSTPTLVSQFNPQWLASQLLFVAGFEQEEITIGMSKDNFSAEQVSKANKAIEQILLDKQPEECPDATPLFLTIIHQYMVKNKFKMTDQQYLAMEKYWDKQSNYAAMNAASATQTAPKIDPATGKPVVAPVTEPVAPVIPTT